MAKDQRRTANLFISGFIILFSLFCFLPMLLSLIISFTGESEIMRNGYSFFPKEVSLNAYRVLFSGKASFLMSYGITILVTGAGTLAAVLITSCAAFALANKSVYYRGALSVFFFIPMVFGTGMVPWYMICKQIGLYNNLLALIVPSLMFSTFNLFLVRNYMSGIPESLREAAMIEGANDVTIFRAIYLPLSGPVIATVVLFYGLAYWNDWWNAIMLVDDQSLYPIQYLMLKIKSETNMANQMSGILGSQAIAPTESLKMATCMVTIGPIVLLYPFLQKYFVKGLIVGSVKG